MKQTVLNQPLACLRRQLRVKTALCALVIVLTLILNLILVLCVSDRTNSLFCLINIVSDVLCGVLVIWLCSVKISPLRNLYRLAQKPMREMTGTVKALSEHTVRYLDMDCIAVTLDDRQLFLPVDSMRLQANQTYRFRLVSNLIMEAEQ